MSIESVIPSNHFILCIPPTPSALNLPQYQDIFQWVDPSHQVAKVLEFQLQHQSFQWIFRVDFQLHPKILPSDIVILGITLQQMNQRVSQSLAVVLWSALFNTINHTPFLYSLQMGFSNYTLARSPSYLSSPSEVPSWVLITLLALCPPAVSIVSFFTLPQMNSFLCTALLMTGFQFPEWMMSLGIR